MTLIQLNHIKEHVASEAKVADKILMGDLENYDGADGARTIADLCALCDSLIEALECHIKKDQCGQIG